MSSERAKLIVQLQGRCEAISIGIKHVEASDKSARRQAQEEAKRPQASLWQFVDSICKTQGPSKPQ